MTIYPPGYRFGRGIVIKEIRMPRAGKVSGERGMQLLCDCGTVYEVQLNHLTSIKAPTRSCGCLRREVAITPEKKATLIATNTVHGLAGTGKRHSLYGVWANMKHRCYNPDNKQFKDYGGRGITVCERWRDNPQAFIEDILSLIGPRPPKKVLDRKNNDGNYEPNNIRWVTRHESTMNRRRDGGLKLDRTIVLDIKRRLSIEESGASIARLHNISESTVSKIKKGKTWKQVQLQKS